MIYTEAEARDGMTSMASFNERSTRSTEEFFVFCLGRSCPRSSSTCNLNISELNSIPELLLGTNSGPWLNFRRFVAGAAMA
jgi:hypothetical protein